MAAASQQHAVCLQAYFLPRLADGTLIPCFGLTGPQSGSDATSLIGSYGVVESRGGELGVVRPMP